ncbi:hypothetical protein [Streptomyces sennicomposti]
MSDDIVPREQAFAEARAVFDRALERIARDRAAGRLSPEQEATVREAERRYAEKHGAAGRETPPQPRRQPRRQDHSVSNVIPREQAIANAPADLDTARVRAAAITAAARIWRHGLDAMDRMTVPDAARACYQPGGPSLAELEQRITADRAARHRGAQPSRPAGG